MPERIQIMSIIKPNPSKPAPKPQPKPSPFGGPVKK